MTSTLPLARRVPPVRLIAWLRAEVGLACLQQLLAQDDIALTDADHIPLEEADVLGLLPFCDEGEEVELAANSAATGTESLLAGDLNGREVGKGRNALSGVDRVKTLREKRK